VVGWVEISLGHVAVDRVVAGRYCNNLDVGVWDQGLHQLHLLVERRFAVLPDGQTGNMVDNLTTEAGINLASQQIGPNGTGGVND